MLLVVAIKIKILIDDSMIGALELSLIQSVEFRFLEQYIAYVYIIVRISMVGVF